MLLATAREGQRRPSLAEVADLLSPGRTTRARPLRSSATGTRYLLLGYLLRYGRTQYGRIVLSAEETRAAESLLAGVYGARVRVVSAEKIWDRNHILRLTSRTTARRC